MSDQFIGEIRLFGFNFAVAGWAMCDGQTQSISQNAQLYQLIGTTYGGDGQSTFNLPNLQGRIPVHQGTDINNLTYIIGQLSGTENVTLTTPQIPIHSHQPLGSSSAGSTPASGNTYADGPTIYSATAPSLALNTATVSLVGSSLPHDNLMPFVCLTFCIALTGVYPV